jgi:hypothetical protein
VILVVFVVVLIALGSWVGRQIFARPLVDSEHIPTRRTAPLRQ